MTDDLFDDFDGLDPEKALEHMQGAQAHKWQGTLLTMLEAVRAALRRKHLDAAEVNRLAPAVTMGLCDALGGTVGYIPRGDAVKKALRDARLYDDWCGNADVRGLAPPALSKKYHMAIQSVYAVLAQQRALHRRDAPDLFGYQDEGDKG